MLMRRAPSEIAANCPYFKLSAVKGESALILKSPFFDNIDSKHSATRISNLAPSRVNANGWVWSVGAPRVIMLHL